MSGGAWRGRAKPHQAKEKDMGLADDNAIFLHCLPAHRGEEISFTMLEDAQSMVWHQAENRLHAQQSLLEFLLAN